MWNRWVSIRRSDEVLPFLILAEPTSRSQVPNVRGLGALTLDHTPECMLCEKEHRNLRACCSSPAAICYWFAVSLISWGILALVGAYWRPLRGPAAQTILMAMAIGCFANWIRNRTFHCGITGPLFLIVAMLLVLSDAHIIRIGNAFMWPTVLLGSAIAFLLEWRYASHAK